MGNTESNERRQPKYKIFKITRVENNKDNDYIKVYLHDYVTYTDGNYKHVYLEKKGMPWLHGYKEGNYLEIDLNEISCESSGHDFKPVCGPVKELGKSQVIEKRDSNGNIIFTCAEILNGIYENRERQYAIQLDARASNYARIRQTSYDMPPKW